jgi:hypothetical protein
MAQEMRLPAWSFPVRLAAIRCTQKISGEHFHAAGAVEAEVKQKGRIVTPSVRYNLTENEKSRLNLLEDARYLWLDSEIKVEISGPLEERSARVSDSGGKWDAVVGVNGQIERAEKWYLPYYVDVGTGQTDLTWQAFAGVGYRFKKLDALLGYRYMDWDFDDNEVFDDLNPSGVFVGAKFWF